MFTRRAFLGSTAAAILAHPVQHASCSETRHKKIAIIASVWHYLSHAQHIGDRFLVGYPHNGEWHKPAIDVASLWVDQKPKNDQSEARAKEFGFKVYPTIGHALRLGGNKLAVDGVLIIAEHGEYPRNKKGQHLYPRYEFFQQVAAVFEKDGRSVPVYNDKHLSYSWEKAKKMVEASKRLGFPMLAGSSVPVTWRVPPLELPYDCDIEDALVVGPGASDNIDYHALEGLQGMVERRRGGETGVKSVQLLEGDSVWDAGDKGIWSKDLLEAALSRSNMLQGVSVEENRPQNLAKNGDLQKLVKKPAVYLIERNDGLRDAFLQLNGALGDFTFAAKLKRVPQIQSTQFYLSPVPNVTYSACLVAKIEEMIETGKAPYPVERTQIVSAILDKCLDSKIMGNKRLETPELDIRYRAPKDSHFCQ